MTSLAQEQYLALSRFAYNNFDQVDVADSRDISYLISHRPLYY